MTRAWWSEPTVGDIVWCHFPDNITPRSKPRPALILKVFDDEAPQFHVNVAYGTSQRTTTLYSGEYPILLSYPLLLSLFVGAVFHSREAYQ